MAPADSKHDCHLEAGLLPTAGEEKTNITHPSGPGNSINSARPTTPTRRMSLLRRAVLAVLLCFIMGFSLTTAANPRPLTCQDDNCDMFHTKAPSSQADSKVYQFLQSASPEALHEFLHKYFPDKYQDGVYETDNEAVEAVLQADQPDVFPPLPQLVRRQDDGGNGTVTTTTSVPPDTTTEVTSTFVPPTTSTTSSEPSTTSQPPETTTTSDEPSTTTTTEAPTSDAESTTATATTTTSAEATTSVESSKIISSSPVPHTFTRTLGDGGTTVITSTSWVAVGPTEQTTASEPDLQDDASRPRTGLAVPAAVGALVGAMLMV